ncbi:mitochondrial fission ELM1 family protein [Marinobacter sp. 1Y8]
MTTAPTPILWLLHDDKPGHNTQLRGLANRLKALSGAQCYWIDCDNCPVSFWRALFGVAPSSDELSALPVPDMILAAGSKTHRLLFALRRRKHAMTTVLMRPSLPLHWLDTAIIPEHDAPVLSDKTLVTKGVLNTITPMAKLTERHNGLLLIGGPSKHFEWDDERVLAQIAQLRKALPGWHWTLSSSRRTPEALLSRLAQLQDSTLTVKDHRQTHSSWLSQALADSRCVWITPDSVSMVYEGLTSGLPTGLFDIPSKTDSRVARGIAQLQTDQRVYALSDASNIATSPPPAPLWEADRAARWLLDRWQRKQKARSRSQ